MKMTLYFNSKNTQCLSMEGSYHIRLTEEDTVDLQDLGNFFFKETEEGERDRRMLGVISEIALSSREQLNHLLSIDFDDGAPITNEYGVKVPLDLHQILEEEARKMGIDIQEYFQKIVIMTLRFLAEEQQVEMLLEKGLVSDRDKAEELVQFARATPMQLGTMAATLAAAEIDDEKWIE